MDYEFGGRSARTTQDDHDDLAAFREARDASDEDRVALEHATVMRHVGLAESIARRYSGSAADTRDIRQVAMLGLVKASKRFNPELGYPFAAFAGPTISGEIKRYLRDSAWTVRPPRTVQELAVTIGSEVPRLQQTLGHEPSTTEIADALGSTTTAVTEAVNAGHGMYAVSLDVLLDPSSSDSGFAFSEDPAEAVELRIELSRALQTLSARDRTILHLRFSEGLTQREIAETLGVTQMQVSRLIASMMTRLRERMLGPEETARRDEEAAAADAVELSETFAVA